MEGIAPAEEQADRKELKVIEFLKQHISAANGTIDGRWIYDNASELIRGDLKHAEADGIDLGPLKQKAKDVLRILPLAVIRNMQEEADQLAQRGRTEEASVFREKAGERLTALRKARVAEREAKITELIRGGDHEAARRDQEALDWLIISVL